MAGPAEFARVPTPFGDRLFDVEFRHDRTHESAEAALERLKQTRRALRECYQSFCRGIPEAETAARQLIGEVSGKINFHRATYVEPKPAASLIGRCRRDVPAPVHAASVVPRTRLVAARLTTLPTNRPDVDPG